MAEEVGSKKDMELRSGGVAKACSTVRIQELKGIKVYVLDIGATANDSNWIVAMDRVGSNNCRSVGTKWQKCPNYAVLIDHPSAGWMLYDTGSPFNAMEYWPAAISNYFPWTGTEKQTMAHQLSLVGITPAEIKTVVMSHMHMDHAGNLSMFKDTARVYVSRADFANAFLSVSRSPDPGTWGAYVRNDVIQQFKELVYVDEDMELAPGIEIITLPGHTPCVLGLVIHAAGGTIIAVQDAVYTRVNFEGRVAGLAYDNIAYLKSVAKVKALQRKYNAQVWFGHDEEQFDAFKKAPDYYE